MKRLSIENQRGYALVFILVISSAFLMIGLSIASVVAARYESSKRNTYVESAILAADAGVTDTLNVLLTQQNFTGYDTNKQMYADVDKGKAEYSTEVTYDETSELYTITSTGYAYRTPSATTPVNTKTVEVTASLGGQSIPARVAAGPGGLVVNGDGAIGGENIWVNGKVQINSGMVGSTTWTILGPNADTTLSVANKGCGDSTNYPIKCTGPRPGSGEPIQIVNTGNNGIYGTVCATDQVTNTNIFPGLGGQGFLYNCDAPEVIMPQYDRQELYDSMTQTLPGFACDRYNHEGATPPYILRANTIYSGNVTYAPPTFQNCGGVIEGNVYIRGDLNFSGIGGIVVADNDSNGNPITKPPIVAVEGKINIANHWSNFAPNSHGVGAIFISFNSTSTACNTNPSCNSLPSNHLYNSVNVPTVTFAADSTAVSYVFYSYFGTVRVTNGTVGAVSGQRIEIASNGGLLGGGFLTGGINKDSFPVGDAFGGKVRAAIWNIVNYRQVFP